MGSNFVQGDYFLPGKPGKPRRSPARILVIATVVGSLVLAVAPAFAVGNGNDNGNGSSSISISLMYPYPATASASGDSSGPHIGDTVGFAISTGLLGLAGHGTLGPRPLLSGRHARLRALAGILRPKLRPGVHARPDAVVDRR